MGLCVLACHPPEALGSEGRMEAEVLRFFITRYDRIERQHGSGYRHGRGPGCLAQTLAPPHTSQKILDSLVNLSRSQVFSSVKWDGNSK